VQRFQKFMFDTAIFDEPIQRTGSDVATESAEPPPPPPPTYEADQVIAARKEAYEAGLQAGLTQAQQSIDHQVSRALSHLAMVADQWITQETSRLAERERDILAAAIALSKKLFPVLAQKSAFDEMKASILDQMGQNPHEPMLTIILPRKTQMRLKIDIQAAMESRGMSGRFQIQEDANLADTACSLSWGEGGKERLVERLWPFFESAAEEVMAGRHRPLATLPAEPLPFATENTMMRPLPVFVLPESLDVDTNIPPMITMVPPWLRAYDPDYVSDEDALSSDEPTAIDDLIQTISLDAPTNMVDSEAFPDASVYIEENKT